MELKGSRTEANLMAAFAGESQARNNMNKSQLFLKKLLTMKKNMQKCGLKNYMEEKFQIH